MRDRVLSAFRLILLPAFVALALPADAAVIWLYKDVETVSASVSLTGNDGVIHTNTEEASGALFSRPSLPVSAAMSNWELGLPGEYFESAYVASGGSVNRVGSRADLWVAAEDMDCDWVLACSAAALGSLDIIFRPGENTSIDVVNDPYGGTVSQALMDLTTRSLILSTHTTDPLQVTRLGYDFQDDHLYRFVMQVTSSVPPSGDPQASGSLRFYDRVTWNDADIAPVPEPASILLLGSGVAGLIARARKRTLQRAGKGL